MPDDDDVTDRGVDIELLADEIEALRTAAVHFADAVANHPSWVAGAGLDLETRAIRYVRKLDAELERARRLDYVGIVKAAEAAAAKDHDAGN